MIYFLVSFGRLAQLVEHLLDTQVVTGSSPVPSTIFGLPIKNLEKVVVPIYTKSPSPYQNAERVNNFKISTDNEGSTSSAIEAWCSFSNLCCSRSFCFFKQRRKNPNQGSQSAWVDLRVSCVRRNAL